ncbi:RsmB/NOP family class I SAM-dependent RNA methyltransferase [Pacificibacter marinus]|uniref:Ribosomal RNA small subunit methyltransferase B n=1 Tax=Pacificibacter marinus TaxID=658057 RepID=A0A1Y5TJT1_9RHOB|nr:RsmB/NOP family class I SAM-dependent RNA methyltransferase [Pacificibacter marinus]SEL14447.1 16S rRNA (cytosine967-C5)-methyltransferase [Pacificibacter marinus]SLN62071.1 Ribosomal RNA small subunit methyltransferase B [Pacificibacter marinus]
MKTSSTKDAGLDARRAALALLDAVTIEKRLLSEVLPSKTERLVPSERARAQRLVTEALRVLDRCDRMLGPHLTKRPAPHVMNALRLGVFEICELSEASHGVVNSYVSIMQERPKASHFKGLVNAVLRKVSDESAKWDALPAPMLPKWLRKPLLADYGKEVVAAIEAAHAKGAPLDVTAKGAAADVAAALNAEVLPTGSVRVPDGAQVTKLSGFEDGDWWVQDAAAALPARILAPQKGERILDMCAAPGGKTMQISAAGAEVTALDISASRMKRVVENLKRMYLPAIPVVMDALEYEAEPFDAILLDAPCTATGTIRRHPDLPYSKDGSDFPGLFELQEHMIDRALQLLKPEGRLVYCTCSLLIDEGEEQIRDALVRHPDLRVDLDALTIDGVETDWIGPEGLRTRPDFWADRGGMDGFFVTVLRRS